MRITIQETGNMDAEITSKFKARATIAINGEGHEVSISLYILYYDVIAADYFCSVC